jgi:hypothetical protein
LFWIIITNGNEIYKAEFFFEIIQKLTLNMSEKGLLSYHKRKQKKSDRKLSRILSGGSGGSGGRKQKTPEVLSSTSFSALLSQSSATEPIDVAVMPEFTENIEERELGGEREILNIDETSENPELHASKQRRTETGIIKQFSDGNLKYCIILYNYNILICNLLSFYFEILDNSPVTQKEVKIIINLLEKIEENQEEIKQKQIKLESEVSDLRKLMEKNEIDEIYEKEFIKVNNI